MAHSWNVEDDLAALYVSLHGAASNALTLDTLAARRGIDPDSFRMRVGNFKHLAGAGGLSNASKQSREVFEIYGRLPEHHLRKLVE